jgi:hypothetical protein
MHQALARAETLPYPIAAPETPEIELARRLDVADSRIRRGSVADGMRHLMAGLQRVRDRAPRAKWTELARLSLGHPVREILHAEPLTRRAFDKPRGYAGDAPMLDFIYDRGARSESLRDRAPLVREIHGYLVRSQSCSAVRFRRRRLADLIDEAARKSPRPRILSLAAGHLRELDLSAAYAAGELGEFVAVDQDSESLATIQRRYFQPRVTIRPGSVRQILAGRLDLGSFDLVYAAGLYDYLSEPVARRLTEILFSFLRPSGTLLVANFLEGIPDAGYMESFMDWQLIYRSERELRGLAASLPARTFELRPVYDDPCRNIGFLEIVRA